MFNPDLRRRPFELQIGLIRGDVENSKTFLGEAARAADTDPDFGWGLPDLSFELSFRLKPRRSSLQASLETLFPKPAHSERVIGQ